MMQRIFFGFFLLIFGGLGPLGSTLVAVTAPVTLLILGGCSSAPSVPENEAELMYNKAIEFEKDERFEEAIQRFTDVKNKFPYSRFATDAELHIADIQFKRENFVEAQGAYQIFKELHPRHPQIDFVTFRLALSYFNQLPSTIDRDLSVSTKAIQYFNEVITTYGTSAFVAESKETRQVVLKMLAEKELYIARFYFKHEFYDSALVRYQNVLTKYADQGLNETALRDGAVSAFESSDREAGTKLLSRLESEYPQSSQARDVAAIRSKYGVH
jgi:outer membrane protein assembly factor BamD